jgi:hypothetical protein
MKNKGGRPTVMTDETVKKLEEGFTMEFTDLEACLYANISKQSLYDYCKINPEYTDRKETLKNHPKILAKSNIYRSLKKGERTDDSKWYLERKAKKEFGNNVDVTTGGEKVVPILGGITLNNENKGTDKNI